MLAKIAMIAMTTSNSISVKAKALARRPGWIVELFRSPLGPLNRRRRII
jgi:hypothetical protein